MNTLEILRVDFALRIDFLIDPKFNGISTWSEKQSEVTIESVHHAISYLEKHSGFKINRLSDFEMERRNNTFMKAILLSTSS